jgi:hypothetical protein
MKILRYIVNSKTTTIKDYKTPIKEIISSSSLVFLLNPIRSRRSSIKLVWIIFLIGFLFGSIYYVTLNILDYLQYETTTSIYEILEQESEFPTISICSMKNSNFNIEMLYILFQNEEMTNEWQNHMESFTDNEYGNCYRFNSGYNLSNQSIPIKKARKSGLDEGLYFEFYSNTSRYFDRLMIYINNHTKTPVNIYNKGFVIHPGSVNYFIIKRVCDQKLELPYNNCYKNVSKSEYHNQTIIDYLNEKKREYSQKECLYLCDKLKYKEINPCNLSLNYLDEDIYNKAYILDDKQIKRCVESFFKESNNYESCLTLYCPLECDSFAYDISLNSQAIIGYGNISNNSYFYEWYTQFNTYENVSKSFYGLRVYYQDLKFTLISQQPKIELFGLISNVGGTLGLFLGFSFISILEIFEILAELICIKFS